MTGARPTGRLHIGQYFAAFRPFVKSELKDESFFIVSDLHMLTTKFTVDSTRGLRDAVIGLVAEAIGFGVEPETTIFYLQSQVPWQARIYAVIQSLAPISLLTSQISFEEMARHASSTDGPSLGLLGYPVLESSDVISIRATHVTVGQNNLGHFDLMRNILAQLRRDYGFSFDMPEVITGRRNLVGLDGTEKMSKSVGNAIFLRDTDQQIVDKVRAMRTIGDDGVVIPAEYLEALGAPRERYEQVAADLRIGGKIPNSVIEEIIDRTIALVAPIRSKAEKLVQAPDYIASLLMKGCERSQELGVESYDLLVRAVRLPRF
jgi:tryptophanyl-tRNA synthetase